MKDPLDILTSGTDPQCDAIDLTNHPTVQAAIAASHQQEGLTAFGTWFVGALSRGLAMLPGGAIASHILVGSDLPPQTTPAQVSQANDLLTRLGINCSGGTCPPIAQVMQQVMQQAPPALKNLVALLANKR